MDWEDRVSVSGEADLEQVLEPDRDDDEPRNNSESDDNDDETADQQPKRIDPTEKKTKVVRNPRPTLNPNRLTGPRGIQIIEDVFKDFQFQGKGYEREDLDMVMKKLEHWAHRLYPKFKFDDCLEKIAFLGKKKLVSTHIRKIRLNMLQDDNEIVVEKDDDEVEEPVLDEFDLLLNEQIALAKSTPMAGKSVTSNFDQRFDALINEPTETITEKNDSNAISEQQRERMLQNRIIAEKRRLEKMKAAMNKENIIENPSSEITSDEEPILL